MECESPRKRWPLPSRLRSRTFVAGHSLVVLDPATGDLRWTVQTEREYTGAIAVTATHVVGATGRLAVLTPTNTYATTDQGR